MLDLAGQAMSLGSDSGNAIYIKLCEQVPSSTQCLEISFKGNREINNFINQKLDKYKKGEIKHG